MRRIQATRGLIVAGMSILLAACGGPPVATSSGSPGAAAPTPPSTAATAATTPAPTPGPPVASATGGVWTSLRWDAPTLMAPYETVSDVVAYGSGYVAVGQLQTEHGNEAAAWVSADWRTWTRTFLDVPAAGDSTLWRVLPAGSGLVAIGSSGALHCTPPEGEGAVCDPLPIALWTSADGRIWTRVPTPAILAGATIAGMAAGPGGIVVVGDTGWDKPAIWTSTDGVAWHRNTLPPPVFAKAHFRGITAANRGWVLTGFTGGSKPVCCAAGQSFTTPAAWFSADGTDWQPARVDGAKQAIGDGIGRIFVGRDGLVAWGVGSGSSGWTSPDGRRWSPRPTSDGYPVGPSASDGQRILGESYVSHNRLAFWVSTDGVTWRPLAAAGAVDQVPGWPGAASWARTAVLFATGVGLVGENGTDRFPLWFAEAEGPAPALSVTVTPSPTGEPPSAIHINNGTTLEVSVFINGNAAAVVAPDAGDVVVNAAKVASPPWHVEVRTAAGRVLGSMTVPNTVTDYGLRLDLSCGRFDVWFGGPLLGGFPGPGAPGDCAP